MSSSFPLSDQPSEADMQNCSRNGNGHPRQPVTQTGLTTAAHLEPEVAPNEPAANALNGDNSVDNAAIPSIPTPANPAPKSIAVLPTPVPWLPTLEAGQKATLAAVPLIYVIGYLVWAYHAWRYSLGSLPAVQSQYLSAGIVPAFIIGLTLLSTRLIKACLEAIGTLFRSDAPGWKRRLRPVVKGVYSFICLSSAVILVMALMHHLSVTWIELLYPLSYITILGTIVITKQRDAGPSDRMAFDWSDWQSVIFLPGLLAILLISIYVRFVFPNIPQELGGALPRIARLDLDRDSVTAERLGTLFPPVAARSKSKVVETKTLYVFFEGTQFLLVKPYVKWTDNRTYEVEAGTVKGISWLDRDGLLIQDPARLQPLPQRAIKPATR